MNRGGVPEEAFCQCSDGIHYVLAAIEDKKDLVLGEESQERCKGALGLNVIAYGRCDGGNDQRGIFQGGEIYEADPTVEIRFHRVSDGDGNCRLAHAAGADDAHEFMGQDHRPDGIDAFIATDHSLQAGRKALGLDSPSRGCRLLIGLTLSRFDKAIAPAGHIRDVTRAILAIAQHFAESCDMYAEVGLLYRNARPCLYA